MHTARKTIEVTIDASASLSSEVDLGGYRLSAIHMPADWTAAGITFEAAVESGGTFQDVHDDGGTEVSITASDSQVLVLSKDVAENMEALRFIKVRSGTSAAAVAQAAARTLTLVLK